jgi:hypothetical protein
LKHGNTLKRVVLTSSGVAALEVTTVPRVFTESSWNEAAVEAVKTKGSAAGPFVIYCASKTLAEKAAWEFVMAHKSEISWDLAVVNPTEIFGARLSSSPLLLTRADIHTRGSLRSAPLRQLTILIPLNAKSMTPLPVR